MSRISLENRIKSDGSLANLICQEHFLDLNLMDWIITCNFDMSDEDLFDETKELLDFLYDDRTYVEGLEAFEKLTVCEALRLLSNIREDHAITRARHFALKILVTYFLPFIEEEEFVNWDIRSHLANLHMYENDVPFPD